MDDFSREFCNWDKLRERNKIKTEIDNNIKNLHIEDADIYMEYKNFLESIRDYIDKYDKEITYKKEVDKIVSLIDIFYYLSDIEYILNQIRLNIYIKKIRKRVKK